MTNFWNKGKIPLKWLISGDNRLRSNYLRHCQENTKQKEETGYGIADLYMVEFVYGEGMQALRWLTSS